MNENRTPPRQRWVLYTAVACLLGFGLMLAFYVTTPRTSETIPASIATPVPSTIKEMALLPTAITALESFTSPAITPTVPATSPAKYVQTLYPTPTIAFDDPSYSWLQGLPCRAPCWQGITPGKTTFEQAEAILKKNPNVSEFQLGNGWDNITERNETEILWKWGTTSSYLTYPQKKAQPQIDVINVKFDSLLRFDTILKTLGDPSDISAIAYETADGGIYYWLHFYYVQYGVELVYEPLIYTQKPNINSDLIFSSARFTPLNSPSLLGPPGYSTKWQGFHNFDYYCLSPPKPGEREYFDSCKKQMVYLTPTVKR